MRVLSCMLLLALLCTTSTGCSLFKKNTTTPPGSGGGSGPAPAKFPGAQDPILNSNIGGPPPLPPMPNPQGAAKSPTTIFAGRVRDAYDRPVANAYIRLVSVDPKDAGAAPVDVASDARGYFIIQGVKTGQSYKLIARSKQGEKMMAGTMLADAPNTNVLILIREDLVNSSTPPIPGGPTYQPDQPAKGIGNEGASKGWKLGPKQATEPNLPATMTVPADANTAPKAGNPTFAPNIADSAAKDRMPMLKIPAATAAPSVSLEMPKPLPEGSKLDTGPTRVPSCVLVGNHLENLALKDSRGQTWEYKKHGHGKLVLIDFWYLACLPCRETMPAVNRLHQQYGSRGLEVIGITAEKGQDEKKEAEAISKFCSSMQIGYRQLMGRSGTFDAGRQFRINAYPTMMLLSEQGDIIWHHIGRPEPGDLSELERLIQSRLNNRPF